MPVVEKEFVPRGNCGAIFKRRDKELVLDGPAGTGKSRACLEKIHAMCMLSPGMKALIIRQTAVTLSSTVLATYKQWVAEEALLNDVVTWYGGSRQEPAGYRYSNGSFIAVGGMDNPMKIMSSEYDLVYVNEATELSLASWEMITTRLRNGRVSFQQLIADCNPNAPTHWLKKRAEEGKTLMLATRHEDNPRYFDEDGVVTPQGAEYMLTLDNLTGVRKLRLRDGKWVGVEGQIHDEFDEEVHVIDRMPAGWEIWDRYWTVDFGFTNPFVLQCWAVDPDGRLYLYREIYKTRTLVEDHALQILDIVAPKDERGARVWTEPQPVGIICDHDAEDRATLERHLGMPTQAARKTVSDGLQAVQSRWRIQPDGRPRLFILRTAPVAKDPLLVQSGKPCDTLSEIPGYVWDAAKEKPLKENDHGQDAKRYMVAELDLRGEYRLRYL